VPDVLADPQLLHTVGAHVHAEVEVAEEACPQDGRRVSLSPRVRRGIRGEAPLGDLKVGELRPSTWMTSSPTEVAPKKQPEQSVLLNEAHCPIAAAGRAARAPAGRARGKKGKLGAT